MPDAPAWLREAFRDGVDERIPRDPDGGILLASTRRGALPACWLAKFDPAHRPCGGPLERFHFIGRQRVRNAVWESLRDGAFVVEGYGRLPMLQCEADDLVRLAEWDARNGGIGCEGHHRRFDNHATPDLVVPLAAVPNRTIEFAYDWGIEAQLEKFPT